MLWRPCLGGRPYRHPGRRGLVRPRVWLGSGETEKEGEESEGSGGGGGGGSRVRGVAVIEVAPDGVRVHPILDQTAVALAGIAFAAAAAAIMSRMLLKLVRG